MADSISVTVPSQAWHGDIPMELTFPKSWQVAACNMQGHDAPELDDAGLRKAFASPIGTPTIRELAKTRHEAAIIIDDMTRPTQIAGFITLVLEESQYLRQSRRLVNVNRSKRLFYWPPQRWRLLT